MGPDERKALYVDHLERRRQGLEAAQWQAPALTVAAQAFLLSVLTDRSIGTGARSVILAAGVAACVAAILSLIRLRSREVLYSDAIAYRLDKLDLPDPRPDRLETKPLEMRHGWWSAQDRKMQKVGDALFVPMYLAWSGALSLFVIADIVALVATR